MIKFFRVIRQNLLNEGKTSKYFKYAIGEIVLVVIGILLALSINNWNTSRQIKASNKLYLNKMVNDLNVTIARLNYLVYSGNKLYPSLQEAIGTCDSVLKLTYHGLSENNLDYLISAKISNGNSILNISDNTYMEMLNTGRLYTLDSDTLTNAITHYYKLCEREDYYNSLNSATITKGASKFEDSFTKLFMDYELNPGGFQLKNYPFYFDKNSKEYKDFQTGIAQMKDGQQNNMRKMIDIIKYSDSLKSIIKRNLKYYD